MSKLKNLGVAAAFLLVAASAMATNFRASDQVYVPAAGHIVGGDGSTFATDVFISNLSSDTVKVTIYFVGSGPSGSTTPSSTSVTLAGNERREMNDILVLPTSSGGFGLSASAPSFGQLIFNGCLNGASCGVDTQDPNTGESPNFRNISVETRTYAFKPGIAGTTGQLFSGYPWYNYVSELSPNGLNTVFVTGIRNTGGPGQAGTFRTNLGAANASQFSSTTIVFKLYNGSNPSSYPNSPIGTANVNLGPLGVMSPAALSSLFSGANLGTGVNLFATIQQTNSAAISSDPNVVPTYCQGDAKGCPGFYAYGSVVDNTTSDATTLEPQYLFPLTDQQINCIYPGAGSAACKGTPVFHRAARH